MKTKILWLLLLLAAMFCGCKSSGHACSYKLCPFKGQQSFENGCGNCLNGSECWLLDSGHFVFPSLNYDQLESKIFQ